MAISSSTEPAAPQASTEPSARRQVRNWLRQQIEGQAAVSLPAVVNAAVKHFARKPKVVEAFLREALTGLIYDEAQRICAKTRGGGRDTHLILLGDQVVPREQLVQERRGHRSRFDAWLEHNGQRHVCLLDMTREDLLVAARLRQGRAQYEGRLGRLWECLAEQLQAGQRVRERFSPAEIEQQFAQLADEREED